MPMRREPPQLIVAERAAHGAVEIVNVVDAVDRLETAAPQFIVDVVALEFLAGVVGQEVTGVAIPTVFRHHVHHHAAGGRFSGTAVGQRHDDLLGARGIDEERAAGSTLHHRVVAHAVLQKLLVALFAAVDRHADGQLALAATDVLGVGRADHRRHERGVAEHALVGWHRIQKGARERLLLVHVLNVDERALAGDGDGLGERSDVQLNVDGGGEVRRQLDALPLGYAEARQREGDRVGARPQLRDLVLALTVGHSGADPLDQRRTAGFDRHAWQHRPRRVFHDSGDGAGGLGPSGCRRQHRARKDHEARTHSFHLNLPWQATGCQTSAPPRYGEQSPGVFIFCPAARTHRDCCRSADI